MAKRKRRSRAKRTTGLPKGAYRLPTGGIVLPSSISQPDDRGRRIRVTGIRHEHINQRKLAEALVYLLQDQQAREAQSDDADELVTSG